MCPFLFTQAIVTSLIQMETLLLTMLAPQEGCGLSLMWTHMNILSDLIPTVKVSG